jgi:hypothetical protein
VEPSPTDIKFAMQDSESRSFDSNKQEEDEMPVSEADVNISQLDANPESAHGQTRGSLPTVATAAYGKAEKVCHLSFLF